MKNILCLIMLSLAMPVVAMDLSGPVPTALDLADPKQRIYFMSLLKEQKEKEKSNYNNQLHASSTVTTTTNVETHVHIQGSGNASINSVVNASITRN